MTRPLRACPAGIAQHIVQRGNNRMLCFAAEEDFMIYTIWLADAATRANVRLHAWVLLPDRVHLLATPQEDGAVSRMMQSLGRRYVQYFNRTYQRTGTLWEGRFKASLVESGHHLLTCQHFIESKPVRHLITSDPARYGWSSFRAHTESARPKGWSPHSAFLALGDTDQIRRQAYRNLVRTPLPDPVLAEIRAALIGNLAFGSKRFRENIEYRTGIRQSARKRGRPRREENLSKDKVDSQLRLL